MRAATACMPMALTWWEITSCRSQAMLLRSSAMAAAIACRAAACSRSERLSSSAMYARRAVVYRPTSQGSSASPMTLSRTRPGSRGAPPSSGRVTAPAARQSRDSTAGPRSSQAPAR
ncbi:hypothetical protein [Nonomuraea aurantiaca]|uniref:hypothetical protein n=1 Tax=Nonomuraea aurantiaca TaxID=2878562 RepID=UPI001CD9D35A|nr:hypothetical protein [Nonomuraea aurantiaca]MCA2223761.1 hypothetical protein [Nonomuraea aurantiaca]